MQNISKRRSRFCEFSNLVPRGVVTSHAITNSVNRVFFTVNFYSASHSFLFTIIHSLVLFVASKSNFVQIIEPILNCNTDLTQAIYIDFLFIDLSVML